MKENHQIYLSYQFCWGDQYGQSARLVLVSCIMIGTVNIENRKVLSRSRWGSLETSLKIGIIQQEDLTLASQFALAYQKLC